MARTKKQLPKATQRKSMRRNLAERMIEKPTSSVARKPTPLPDSSSDDEKIRKKTQIRFKEMQNWSFYQIQGPSKPQTSMLRQKKLRSCLVLMVTFKNNGSSSSSHFALLSLCDAHLPTIQDTTTDGKSSSFHL